MSTATPSKSAPARKYESFVEDQLTRARVRIRFLDVMAASLGLLIFTLGYGLLMAVLDAWLRLPAGVRQAGFAMYLLLAVAYVAVTVVRPLLQRVNPYYAARQVEQAVPDAKNSVVNWLDLHEQPLPPAIRGALTNRAAKDLASANLEQAISGKRTGWLGGVLTGLFVAVVVLFLLGPRQFSSLVSRVFSPFDNISLATRTSITVIQPETGDVTVPIGRPVPVTVRIEGKVPDPSRPDALKLLFRYLPSDPFEERPLERGTNGQEWTTVVTASEVHNGFWYKVTGGDAQTPEYRVQVRSNPLVTSAQVKYHYRPYLRLPDKESSDPNLEGLRGTEVTLLAQTNRTVRDGRLDIGDEKRVAGERVPDDAHALRFRFVLEQDGEYRIWFTSTDDERNADPMPYTIKVSVDQAPHVELTKPGQDLSLPANGVLRLEGFATDDFGVQAMTLKILADAEHARPYRAGKTFQREDGSFPARIEYKDFVDLDTLKLRTGQPLQPGMEIWYWLEATDNCDYPAPNVGKSDRFRIKIAEPVHDGQKQQQERQQARNEQQQHDKDQDQKLDQNKPNEDPGKPKDQPNAKDQPPEQPEKQKPAQAEKDLQKKAQDLEKAINDQDKQKPDQKQEPSQGDKDGQSQKNPDDKNAGQKDQAKEGNGQQKNNQNQPDKDPKDSKPNDQGEQKANPQGKDAKNKDGQPNGEPSNTKNQPMNQEGQKEGSPNDPSGAKQKDGQKNDQNRANDPGMNRQENKDQQSDGAKAEAGKKDDNKAEDGQPEKRPGEKNDKKDGKEQKQGKPAAGQDKQPGDKPQAQRADGAKDDKNGQKDGSSNPQKNKDAAAKEQPTGKEAQPKEGNDKEPEQGQSGDQNDNSKRPDQPGKGQKEGQQDKSQGDKNGEGQKEEQGQTGDADKKGQVVGQKDQGKPKGQSDKQQSAGKDSQPKEQQGDKDGQQGDKQQDKSAEGSAGNKQSGKPEKDSGKKQSDSPGDPAEKENAGGAKDGHGKDPKDSQAKENAEGKDKKGSPSTSKEAANQHPSDAKNKSGAEDKTNESKDGPANGAKESKDGNADKGAREERANKDGEGAGDKKAADKLNEAEIEKLIQAIQNGDAKVRREAADKLKDAKDRLTDPRLRKAVEEALAKTEQKPSPPEKSKNAAPSDASNDRKAEAGDGKGKDPMTGKKTGDPNGQSKDGKGHPGDPSAKSGEQSQEAGQKPQNPSGGPGNGLQGNRVGEAGNTPDPQMPESPVDPKHQQRAGSLQLETLKKKVTPDVLKKANMTEAEYREFLKGYEEMLKRKPVDADLPDKLTDPKATGGAMSNRRSRQVSPRGDKKDDLQHGAFGQPPPEFRDACKEFTQKLSDLDRKK